MKRAGCATFEAIRQGWPQLKRLIVVCGGGNNGGDGYVVAALAAQKSLPVTVFSMTATADLRGDAKRAYEFALQEGVEVRAVANLCFENVDDAVVVDGILGTGFKGELREHFQSVTQRINACGFPVVSLDIPSGLDGDSGIASEGAVKATKTVTFVGLKRGLLTANGPQFCGEIIFDDLDIPQDVYHKVSFSARRIADVNLLPPRRADAHKQDFGHVLVVGGDLGMGGAAMLAAEAALRSGAGLVSLATRPEHVAASLARLPEVMAHGIGAGPALEDLARKVDVIVLGPGLGQSAWSRQLLYFALRSGKGGVIDADALNLIAQQGGPEYDLSQWIITPHPGEAARLLNCTSADIQADRFAAVSQLQRSLGGVAVLKGAGTLIADDNAIFLASVGNPGMAVAGMGDVLSGVVGAALAQGLSLVDAAKTAVCAHGNAGNLAAAQGVVGVKASDMMPFLRMWLNSAVVGTCHATV